MLKSKVVKTDESDLSYDLLLIAMGSHPTYFGINGIQENSVTLGSYEEAKKIREKIFELYKNAEINDPPNFVIGGAGFTGVELAGEIIESIPKLSKEFGVKEPKTKLTIVEALPTILPGWDEKLIEKGTKFLQEQGVNLHLSDPVVEVNEKSVKLKSGTVLQPDLFIWTGGVEADPACGKGFEIKSRRIVVDEYLQHKGVEDVFIAGDQACAVDSNGKPMPPNAHIAMMQADFAVHNILAKIRGETMKKYTFEHAGEIVTFGKDYAVGEIFGYNFYGLLAKIMKQFIHVWYLHSIGGINLIFEYW